MSDNSHQLHESHRLRHPLTTIPPHMSKQRNMKSLKQQKHRRRRSSCSESAIKGKRYNRYMTKATALREHRERLAQTTQDTFHTVLTTQTYQEDVITDDDTVLIASGASHDLSDQIMRSRQATSFYPHHSPLLAAWEKAPLLSEKSNPQNLPHNTLPTPQLTTSFEFVSLSTLSAARNVRSSCSQSSALRIGVLNSSSPKRAGGASLSGGDTQEECLVRQTTLLDSLQNSNAGRQFYSEHRSASDGSGLHDHSLLFSPGVIVFKDDRGRRIPPYAIDVVSGVPVNASTVLAKFSVDNSELLNGIRVVMKERMARILRLFEERGDKTLILSAFGVGQFCNSPDMIGEIWADLLSARDGKFRDVFDKVIFAIPPKHLTTFENSFGTKVLESELLHE